MKIICVGRNYADHAREMGASLPEHPVLFMKPDTAVLRPGQDFYYPEFTHDLHYECEVFFRISKEGKYIRKQFVSLHLDGIGLGIDFTARDLQSQLKAQGLPWEISKAFNASAPISEVLPIDTFANLKDLHFELKINGETRQQGHTADMIFDLDELIVYSSKFFTLRTGDLFFTGTPQGVGPVKIGDRLQGFLEDRLMFDFYIR